MKERFIIKELEIDGLAHIIRNPIKDSRGYLERLFCINELSVWGNRPIKQINRTYTKEKGTIRGLHFQRPPHAECKFITCLSGSVFDVAIDLRTNSETYGEWFGVNLDANENNGLLIPEGFAHGFQTLNENVEMLYLHSERYNPKSESGINPLDNLINIKWPLNLKAISKKDKSLENFKNIMPIKL